MEGGGGGRTVAQRCAKGHVCAAGNKLLHHFGSALPSVSRSGRGWVGREMEVELQIGTSVAAMMRGVQPLLPREMS